MIISASLWSQPLIKLDNTSKLYFIYKRLDILTVILIFIVYIADFVGILTFALFVNQRVINYIFVPIYALLLAVASIIFFFVAIRMYLKTLAITESEFSKHKEFSKKMQIWIFLSGIGMFISFVSLSLYIQGIQYPWYNYFGIEGGYLGMDITSFAQLNSFKFRSEGTRSGTNISNENSKEKRSSNILTSENNSQPNSAHNSGIIDDENTNEPEINETNVAEISELNENNTTSDN